MYRSLFIQMAVYQLFYIEKYKWANMYDYFNYTYAINYIKILFSYSLEIWTTLLDLCWCNKEPSLALYQPLFTMYQYQPFEWEQKISFVYLIPISFKYKATQTALLYQQKKYGRIQVSNELESSIFICKNLADRL